MNGKAFVNFSAFLGDPDDAHFKPRPSKGSRKKYDKKIKRDNDRAARFQDRKRKEGEAASVSKPAGDPEAMATSSPGAESVLTASDLEFSFASPVPETLRHDTSYCQELTNDNNFQRAKNVQNAQKAPKIVDDLFNEDNSTESVQEETKRALNAQNAQNEDSTTTAQQQHSNSTNRSAQIRPDPSFNFKKESLKALVMIEFCKAEALYSCESKSLIIAQTTALIRKLENENIEFTCEFSSDVESEIHDIRTFIERIKLHQLSTFYYRQ